MKVVGYCLISVKGNQSVLLCICIVCIVYLLCVVTLFCNGSEMTTIKYFLHQKIRSCGLWQMVLKFAVFCRLLSLTIVEQGETSPKLLLHS